MKPFIITAVFLTVIVTAFCQNNTNSIALIPLPVSIQPGKGSFTITNSTFINLVTTDADATRVAGFLSKKLGTATGFSLQVKSMGTASKTQNAITLSISNNNITPGKEGYKLIITQTGIDLQANTAAGLFYGTQTLVQLLPKEIEGKQTVRNVSWVLPATTITDYPRFGWRGLMLDVSRHFFTKQEVKNFIDDMVKYKYNLLHLHLTDDQGWRIEIKSLPKLTEIGAWRPKREGKWGNTQKPDVDEPKTYGGFYTQEDVKEIVQYAKDRFVSILPEVDIPGHSLAAIASYPELSCTPGEYHVNVGDRFMDWPGPVALIDNNLCPASEKVYNFLDKVFTEIAQLFPFEYIHMGGDEAAKNMWAKSDVIKTLMQKEGLKNMEEVQSYFVKRVEKIIQSKGKKMMGWDEILEGGLAPDASVMSWRGMKGGIEAAKMNHHVVMSPTDFVYLDYMQGDPITEPLVYASLRLNQTYKFDPLPQGVDAKFILGGQGNIWTEQIPNMRTVQYMTWPRGLAIAESVWSQKEKKDWNSFVERVEKQFERMDEAQIKYAKTIYEPIFKASVEDKDKLQVTLETEIPNLDIYYSFDETNPDEFYPKYKTALTVPKDAATLKVITFRNGKTMGRQINMPVAELQKRAQRKR
ncbi:MAG: family 20 glycosylhydrolase [Bacteroidota bacterium]|nr:family 20 glycosylhydrolase [Bacteroidota bacterium]